MKGTRRLGRVSHSEAADNLARMIANLNLGIQNSDAFRRVMRTETARKTPKLK
jgi:hypothetical protein